MTAPTAEPLNARATFMWLIEVESPDGLIDAALVQAIKIPKANIQTVEIGRGGVMHPIHIAVGVMWDELTLKNLKKADVRDDWAWKWLKTVTNPVTGKMGRPSEYKKRCNIHLLDNDMEPIHTMTFQGCMIVGVDIGELDARNKEIMIEEITIKVDKQVA